MNKVDSLLEIDSLLKKAKELHNSRSIDERKILCISSAATQIQTLQNMKYKIMKKAGEQCNDIDIWIGNIALNLEENLKEIEKKL